MRRVRRPKFRAYVHYGSLWFNQDPQGRDVKRLAKALLDAGIPVEGYWADCNYACIDPRISSRNGRRP